MVHFNNVAEQITIIIGLSVGVNLFNSYILVNKIIKY